MESSMLANDRKHCPACQALNDAAAPECVYCGIPFGNAPSGTVPTKRQPGGVTRNLPQEMEQEFPENGVAVFLTNYERPFDTCLEDDFIIGRKTDEAQGRMVDLSAFHAFNLGISRQHVRIQRAGTGYLITDLNSTNGTWLNGERLLPNQTVKLPSAAQLRLGKMRLFIVARVKN
jgi:pSer/pThr/pTyr-binding forkhead associated (FHA) protein